MFGVDSVDGLYIDTETNTTDIRIFVRFALFEHNLCYPTIRLQPCGFAYALFVRPIGVGMHIIRWWNILVILATRTMKWVMTVHIP